MSSSLYFDNSTTAKPSEKAVSEMIPFYTTYWGVPSSPHKKGQELYPFLSDYYRTIYEVLNAEEEDHFVLTSSGAEAVNHVICSTYKEKTIPTGKNQFLSSAVSEAPAIMATSRLESMGVVGKLVEVTESGIVTVENLTKRLSPRTALLSLPFVNGLTGVVQPLEEIAALCKQRDILLHIDITHAIGKIYCDLNELGADFITFNGEQIHAPKGVGGLLIRKQTVASPFIFGSADQAGLRAGNFPMPLLAGFAKALEEAFESCSFLCMETARLRTRLEEGILASCPGTKVCFQKEERAPHITTILFPHILNEALLFELSQRGVYATMGGGNFQQISIILTACGIDSGAAQTALSFSLSRYTTESEVDGAIKVIKESASLLLKIRGTIE